MVVAAPAKATPMPHPLIVRAIRALTDRDSDRAQEDNGIGWNGLDTFLGHALAAIPPQQWGEKETYWAYQVTHKYRRQLASVGIDWDAIPAPRLVAHPGEWHRERKARYQEERERDYQEERVDRDYQEFLRSRERQQESQRRVAQDRRIEAIADHVVAVRFRYDPVLKDEVKLAVKGIHWDGDARHWFVAINADSIPGLLRIAQEHHFQIVGPVAGWIEAIVGRAQALLVASKAESTSFRFDGLKREPYPFQWAGIEYAIKAERCFIADAPGLGKTIQAIATLYHLKARYKLVICPANVKYTWRDEIDKTLAGEVVCIIDGLTPWPIYPEADWYIVNHNISAAHLGILCQQIAIDAIVIDEGHYLVNPKAARTLAVQAIIEPIATRLILTGTAILNRPKELLAQLKILGRLKDVAKSEWFFKKRYCAMKKNDWGKWDDSDAAYMTELNQKLRESCYIRREKADVLTELPPKRRIVLDVPLRNRKEYDRAEADMVRWLAERAVSDRAFRAQIAHLDTQERLDAIAKRREDSEKRTTAAEALVRFNALKRLAAQGKIESVKEWVADFLKSGQKLVVFGWYRETVDELCKALEPIHGKPVPHIHGGDSSIVRHATIESFQNDPTTRLLVCNIIAAGEGITLTAASDVFFAEMAWNPGKQDQAEDRVHRIGQRDSVTAWYMLATDTIEGDIYDIIAEKRIVTTAVIEGTELPEHEIHTMREVATRLRKRSKLQAELPMPVADDSPPWDTK